MQNTITIIIPVYNEAEHLRKLLPFLKQASDVHPIEILVSDGGSSDESRAVCEANEITVLSAGINSRSIQMNKAANLATGQILYFVHADTTPPKGFAEKIIKAISAGFDAGRFTTEFDSDSKLLKFNAYFTKFDWFMCYGGDQTLFLKAGFFQHIGGFDESLAIMEDYEITERIKKQGRYTVLREPVKVSARKYNKNSWWQVQKANYKAVQSYKKRKDTAIIKQEYLKRLKK